MAENEIEVEEKVAREIQSLILDLLDQKIKKKKEELKELIDAFSYKVTTKWSSGAHRANFTISHIANQNKIDLIKDLVLSHPEDSEVENKYGISHSF